VSTRGRRRGGRFRRRPEGDARPAAARSAPSAPVARRERLTLVLAVLAGILIGRFAFALLPLGVRSVFDFAMAGAFALALAMTYRRSMRRYLAAQRERRS
jgi:predicted secreted protein